MPPSPGNENKGEFIFLKGGRKSFPPDRNQKREF
jgi:hypothetical protein